MTCIVGLEHNNSVYIGGDSLGSTSGVTIVRQDKKVFHNGETLIGFTSSYRMGQLLRYSLKVPKPPERDLDRWMVNTFIELTRDCLKDGGYTSIRNDNQEEGGSFLVGVRARLYRIDSDFQIGRATNGYDAIGSGERSALGALYVATGTPEARLKKALAAAEEYSPGVRRPFYVMKG